MAAKSNRFEANFLLVKKCLHLPHRTVIESTINGGGSFFPPDCQEL